MNHLIVLDTSAYTQLRLGRPEVVDVLVEASQILLPCVVIGELMAGFRVGSRFEDNVARLRELLAEGDVSEIPVDSNVANRYARIYEQLRRSGRPIPTNDMWIAASAQVRGGNLVTYDRDFLSIDELDLTLLEAKQS